eukprot:183177-Rhodomonas_salina.3
MISRSQVNLQGRKPVLVMCGAFYAVGYLLITMGSYVGYGGLLLGRFFTGEETAFKRCVGWVSRREESACVRERHRDSSAGTRETGEIDRDTRQRERERERRREREREKKGAVNGESVSV